ncbi:MAG: hypothetical protein ACPGJV_05030 [Bacteriovoracaceae bacterium]
MDWVKVKDIESLNEKLLSFFKSFVLFSVSIFLLSSCLPSVSTNTATSVSSEDESSSSGGEQEETTDEFPGFDFTDSPDTNTQSDIYWNSGQLVEGILTLPKDFNDSVYLQGSSIHSFLLESARFQKQYCLVANFQKAISSSTLRMRARPTTITDLKSGSLQWGLKIDVSNSTDNQSLCSGLTILFDDQGNPELDLGGNPQVSTASVFNLESVCPSCGDSRTSTQLSLYRTDIISVTGNINTDSRNDIDISSLQLRVDFSNSAVEPVGSCSNSVCRAQGFDCCIDGYQCANDGTLRPSFEDANICLSHVESNPNDYSRCAPTYDVSSYMNVLIQYGQAYADSKLYTNNHIRYPNFYFTCGSDVVGPVREPATTPENPEEEADERLNENIAKFNCLEEGKKESPDYTTNNVCAPGYDQSSHDSIKLSVWKECGCKADPFPTNVNDNICPNFGLRAERDINNNITNIVCDLPPSPVEAAPFQELDLSVSSRSIPHRFFDTAGVEHDDLSTLTAADNWVQEGDQFFYMNEVSKLTPQAESFGMNSILGQISVNLTKALPAKAIDVEFDQLYIISATDGYYSPCPQCAADFWFNSFKTHPPSQGGLGVQAQGYTSNRSVYGDNFTMGNYEDTLFSRACWVPPTMLPYSHKPNANGQTQRLNRLETQAALYVNGYQRDWYGFNYGALIGSFDGVNWFAIGSGRRVQARSSKLYLAINAPFADLADYANMSVSITIDQGNNIASDFDYNPDLALNHPEQNAGASCQKFHQCNTDTDCVTQLGWEYRCLDVRDQKFSWPSFDADSNELASQERSNYKFEQMLLSGLTGESSKRCVYRGQGALCKKSFTTLDSNRPNLQKSFQCAPNFYCADLNSNSFNDRLVRSPNEIDVFFFGKEANYLGRPDSYIGANKGFTQTIKENLKHNLILSSSDTNDYGLCRPGKSQVNDSDILNHAQADAQRRTDYISQISSCNSEASDISRTRGCPIIDMDSSSANYLNFKDSSSSADDNLKRNQNMCGAEAQYFDGSEDQSTFRDIEFDPLQSLFSLTTQGIAKDACLRRAGQVCFTDLDCGPNRLHAEQANFLGLNRFGDSYAEQKYWQEHLVCSQVESKPLLQDGDYFDYDVTQNRCCREIGSDFTMFSSLDSLTLAPDMSTEDLNLNLSNHTADNPTQSKRYSRYNILDLTDELGNSNDLAPQDGLFDTTTFAAPVVSSSNLPKKYQWKTLYETGKSNCCGGGFIRKFADGSRDWSNNNRIQVPTQSFTCLNYRSTIHKEKPALVQGQTWSKDKSKLCTYQDQGGCIQNRFPHSSYDARVDAFNIVAPMNVSLAPVEVSWVPTSQFQPDTIPMSVDNPYLPVGYPFAGTEVPSSTADAMVYTFFFSGNLHTRLSVILPAYAGGLDNIDLTSFELEYHGFGNTADRDLTYVDCTGVADPFALLNLHQFCAQVINGQTVLHFETADAPDNPDVIPDAQDVPSNLNSDPTGLAWEWAGVKFEFNRLGTPNQLTTGGVPLPAAQAGLEPGNDLYYLTKLSRLELLGIPQIFYEPIYCHDDQSQLISGVYDLSLKDRTDFEGNSAFTDANLNQIYDESFAGGDAMKTLGHVVYQDKIDLQPVFSSHEFSCCAKLGSEVDNSSRCCSGFASGEEGQTQTCALPPGTDLNVYFNRFVSNEGSVEDFPDTGLADTDFIPLTGEPKLSAEVNVKLLGLGQQFCSTGEVRKGSLFGFFIGQPNSGFVNGDQDIWYSPVDSSQDFDDENDLGYDWFVSGYKWDHHWYCAP